MKIISVLLLLLFQILMAAKKKRRGSKINGQILIRNSQVFCQYPQKTSQYNSSLTFFNEFFKKYGRNPHINQL